MNKALAIGAAVVALAAAAGGGYYFLVMKKDSGAPFTRAAGHVAPDGTAAGESATDLLGSDGASGTDAPPAESMDGADTVDVTGDPNGAIADLPPPAEGEVTDTEAGDVFGDADKAAMRDENLMPPEDAAAAAAARDVIDAGPPPSPAKPADNKPADNKPADKLKNAAASSQPQ